MKRGVKREREAKIEAQLNLVHIEAIKKIMKQSLGLSHFQNSITVLFPSYVPK